MWRKPWTLPYLSEYNRYQNKALLSFQPQRMIRFLPLFLDVGPGSSATGCTEKPKWKIYFVLGHNYVTHNFEPKNMYVRLGRFVYQMNRCCLIVCMKFVLSDMKVWCFELIHSKLISIWSSFQPFFYIFKYRNKIKD